MTDVQKSIKTVIENLENGNNEIGANFDNLLDELNTSIEALNKNNALLEQTNEDLSIEIDHMRKLVKELKKETKWLWWNGLADKLVAFGGGVGVGVLLAVLL